MQKLNFNSITIKMKIKLQVSGILPLKREPKQSPREKPNGWHWDSEVQEPRGFGSEPYGFWLKRLQ